MQIQNHPIDLLVLSPCFPLAAEGFIGPLICNAIRAVILMDWWQGVPGIPGCRAVVPCSNGASYARGRQLNAGWE